MPTSSGDSGDRQSTGASLWVYGHGNHRTRASRCWFAGQSSFHTNSSSAPSRPEHLTRCGFLRSPRGLTWHQSSSGSMPLEDVVDVGTSQTNATSNSTLPHKPTWASASTSCLIPIGVGRGIIKTISLNWGKKICNCLFNVATVWKQIWGYDHLSCGFVLQWSHLTLKWKSGQGKVGFRWGAVTVIFHVNFSPLEAHNFDPYRFYCLKWGCNNLLSKSIYSIVWRKLLTRNLYGILRS